MEQIAPDDISFSTPYVLRISQKFELGSTFWIKGRHSNSKNLTPNLNDCFTEFYFLSGGKGEYDADVSTLFLTVLLRIL